LKITRGAVRIDKNKVEEEKRFDGKWVLQKPITIFQLLKSPLKYKELWMVEHSFRDVKSVLETRPIFHKVDEPYGAMSFASFLALVLRKELDKTVAEASMDYEWNNIKTGSRGIAGSHPGRRTFQTGYPDEMPWNIG